MHCACVIGGQSGCGGRSIINVKAIHIHLQKKSSNAAVAYRYANGWFLDC